MKPEKPPVLLLGDKDTALWKRIRAHLEAEIKRLDERNRKPWNPEVTAGIRGEIKALEALLKLDKKEPGDMSAIEEGQLPT